MTAETSTSKAATSKAATSKAPAGFGAKLKKQWKLIAVLIVVVAGLAGGAAWFMARNNAAEADKADATAKPSSLPATAQYFALEPVFVVNLPGADGATRYLQVEVQLMTRDPLAVKDMEQHAPAIRARLLMLFSQQDADPLLTRAGKEKLQAVALSEVKKVLVAETGKSGADALLFTSFVMQ